MPEGRPPGRVLFVTDLDGTLFRSSRHRRADDMILDAGTRGPCAFLSPEGCRLLRTACRSARLTPVTTRSTEQYLRIAWPPGCEPLMALASNGAMLLRGGIPDAAWRSETQAIVAPYAQRLARLASELKNRPGVRDCRLMDGAFVCAVCENPAQSAELVARENRSAHEGTDGQEGVFSASGACQRRGRTKTSAASRVFRRWSDAGGRRRF